MNLCIYLLRRPKANNSHQKRPNHNCSTIEHALISTKRETKESEHIHTQSHLNRIDKKTSKEKYTRETKDKQHKCQRKLIGGAREEEKKIQAIKKEQERMKNTFILNG